MRFQGTDKDHNGQIDRAELGDLIMDLGIALRDKETELEVLFDAIDEDHDGCLTFIEVAHLLEPILVHHESQGHEMQVRISAIVCEFHRNQITAPPTSGAFLFAWWLRGLGVIVYANCVGKTQDTEVIREAINKVLSTSRKERDVVNQAFLQAWKDMEREHKVCFCVFVSSKCLIL